MTRVLFVCTANVCRSPYAQLLTAARVPGLDVTSAGTHGWDAAPMDPPMAAELAARGVEPDGFRSRRLTPRLVDEADLVVTMTAAHRSFVLQERPVAVRRTFTLGQLTAGLAESGADAASLPTLLAEVRRARPTATAADDVEDPYRRGPEVAARVAARLDELLGRVLPHLG